MEEDVQIDPDITTDSEVEPSSTEISKEQVDPIRFLQGAGATVAIAITLKILGGAIPNFARYGAVGAVWKEITKILDGGFLR